VTAPALVLLAAGLGSRYGGLKQLDRLGPGGATLMDYAVYDGWRAGFRSLVIVLRPEMVETFEREHGARYRSRFAVRTAVQRLEDLPDDYVPPAGRSRPWGTTHAVLAVRELVQTGFAVLNADDCYGQHAIGAAAAFLGPAPAPATHHAVIGYRLDQTLSPVGGVNRAELVADATGMLREIRETTDLRAAADGTVEGLQGGARRRLDPATPVSMNLWAFTPAIFPVLEAAFRRFLAAGPGPAGESYLPEAVQEGIVRGAATVEVLHTTSRWCGVTHASDREWVQRELRVLVNRGEYPETLWP
jgi:hypothetical protein